MKVSTCMIEVLHLSKNPVQCSLRTSGVSLKHVKKFKYLGVALISDQRHDIWHHSKWILGKVKRVRSLHHLVALSLQERQKTFGV